MNILTKLLDQITLNVSVANTNPDRIAIEVVDYCTISTQLMGYWTISNQLMVIEPLAIS